MSKFEIISHLRPASVNCFFGAISYCLFNNEHQISESDVFSLGKGYNLEVIIDEHGFPELSYPFYKTIDNMANALDIEIATSHFDHHAPHEQLDHLLSQYGPVTVTVDTSYLPYLQDKYSREGYTHAVALCEIIGEEVILEDFFIGGVKPYSARIKMPIASLLDAAKNAYNFKQYTNNGVYRYLKPAAHVAVSNSLRLKSIIETARELISHGGVTDKINEHFAMCCYIASSGGDIRKVMNLLAYDITTDHIVPSRVLLKNSLEKLGVLTEQIEILIKSAIEQWELLAIAARLSSRRSANIQDLRSRYCAVADAENSIWLYLSELRK